VSGAAERADFAVEPGPFDLGDGAVGVLCVHGLTGQPYEVRPIAEALVREGMRAVGPFLAGHEDALEPESLMRVRREEWLSGVRRAYRDLRRDHETVMVAGLSLGGLLSLALAAEEPVDALAVIGVPLALRFPIPQLVPWLRRALPSVPKRRGSDIQDTEARARHPGFDVMPLNAVHELILLQRHVRASLARIDTPILIAHGALDTTANPADARVIESRVSSARRELMFLPNSGHIVPVDRDGPALAEAICGFFSGLA